MSRACLLIAGGLLSVAPAYGQQARTSTALLKLFDFSRGVTSDLPRALQEISGLATTSDGRVFAHADERGVISELDGCTGRVKKSFSLGKPAVRDDFEGIAIAGERFFLITSTGQLYELREGANDAAVPFTRLDTGFGKSCEIEGLAYDSADGVLLIGCKRALLRGSGGRVSVLRWSLARGAPAPSLTMPLATVVQGTKARSFQTTSLELESKSGHYMVLSGPERLLVETTRQGSVLASVVLPGKRHRQPEGVTFVGDTLLMISDEGAGNGRGTITCVRRAR